MEKIINQQIISGFNLSLNFKKDKKNYLQVLNDVSISIKENEIIAIVGKSGAGKSSLLRVLSGLIKPSSGKLFYKTDPVIKPIENTGMVFQNFALLPWLNVLENILFGTDALGISRAKSTPKALEIIKDIGLNGFEDLYTSELSGGMKQRVGFARALMIEPEVLFLDEPFSSLDIITAKKLRDDVINLWLTKKTSTKAIVLVTHNIEEAVLMADRVIVLGNNPGHITSQVNVDISMPRRSEDLKVKKLVDKISLEMHNAH